MLTYLWLLVTCVLFSFSHILISLSLCPFPLSLLRFSATGEIPAWLRSRLRPASHGLGLLSSSCRPQRERLAWWGKKPSNYDCQFWQEPREPPWMLTCPASTSGWLEERQMGHSSPSTWVSSPEPKPLFSITRETLTLHFLFLINNDTVSGRSFGLDLC